jgi:hypothetical protein
LHCLNIPLVNPFIYDKQIPSSYRSALEYISSISTAHISDYCNRKRIGRSLPISNQKKKHTERSLNNTDDFEKSQLLPHTPKVILNLSSVLIVTQKKREKDEYSM